MTATDLRPAAVGGQFYPAGRDALAGAVDVLLAAAPPVGPLAEAFVVPHAGYRYSGPTAAHVYTRLRAHAEAVRRVVLLGPSHRVPLVGCAVPATRTWQTPLGLSQVDTKGAGALVDGGYAQADDRPHAQEHAIEVQLPFLQRVLPAGVPVLPVAIGQSAVDDVAAMLTAAGGGSTGTVVLCSTDLSHYLDEESAQEQDEQTSRAVLDLAADRIGVRDACGVFALRGLLGWARARGLGAGLLHRCTSADTTGDRSRVVGYAAFAFSARPQS